MRYNKPDLSLLLFRPPEPVIQARDQLLLLHLPSCLLLLNQMVSELVVQTNRQAWGARQRDKRETDSLTMREREGF